MTECLFYDYKDVMTKVGCKQSKAYNIIKKINKKLIKEKRIDKDLVVVGKVLKSEFDKIYN